MRLAPMAALTAGLAASLALPTGAGADIYRCVGPDGEVHYTNNRPSGARGCERVVRGRKQGSSAKRRTSTRPARRSGGGSAPRRARKAQYDQYIREAARLYSLPESFIRAVMKVESDYQPTAVSHAGAMGLMQLMPKTAAAMGVRNPFDPRQSILGGARYLRLLANKFNGDLVLTVAGYNAGENAVIRHQGVPPYRETRRYVRRVLQHYYAYRQGSDAERHARAR